MVALAHPFPGSVVSTPFGVKAALGGGVHDGTDYIYPGASCGRRVLAAAAGVARKAENGGGGHGVIIDHGGGVETLYWHLSSQLVAAGGQRVTQGQVIGLAGSSGTLVTGCHLHLGLRVNGSMVDPHPHVAGGARVAAVPAGEPDSWPIDAGQTCPPGWVQARVNPRLHGAIPGSPWWNRPAAPDGTVLACVRAGLQPGDNTAATDVGEGLTGALAALLPLAANVAVILGGVFIGWEGVKRILGAGENRAL